MISIKFIYLPQSRAELNFISYISYFIQENLTSKQYVNAYCTPMYGCQLWNIAYRYNYDRLRVAFNDAFIIIIIIIILLLNVPRWTSASSLFVLHRVPTFAAVIRKLTYSLYDCIRNSSNSVNRIKIIWNLIDITARNYFIRGADCCTYVWTNRVLLWFLLFTFVILYGYNNGPRACC